MKHLERYEPSEDGSTTNQTDKGLLFVHPKFGKVQDLYLDNFQIVGTYVDTLRQLFKGAMNLDFLTDIEDSLSFGEKLFVLSAMTGFWAKVAKPLAISTGSRTTSLVLSFSAKCSTRKRNPLALI